MRRYLLVTVAALFLGAVTARAEDAVAVAIARFDSQVGRSRDVFDRSLKSAIDATVHQLIGIADRAEKNKNPDEAARAYKEILRLDRNQEQARSYFEKQGQLDEVNTQLTREWTPAILPGSPKWEENVFYETMLGSYNNGTTPMVTLVIPKGENVHNNVVAAAFSRLNRDETGDTKLHVYRGSGRFVAPDTGNYMLSIWCRLFIDGKDLGRFDRDKPTVVFLEKGMHEIAIEGYEDNGSKMHSTVIEILNKTNNQQVPIFNSLADIKQFLNTPLNGRQPVEISGWDPAKARALRVELPGKGK